MTRASFKCWLITCFDKKRKCEMNQTTGKTGIKQEIIPFIIMTQKAQF